MFDVPFCVLLALTATLLPHFWRRHEAKLAINWGVLDLEEEHEPCRPEHYGDHRINPVTNEIEPYFSTWERVPKYGFSVLVLLVIFITNTTILLLCMVLRHEIKDYLWGGALLFQILLAFVVEILNSFSVTISRWLTNNENHRTQTEFEYHALCKSMSLNFVNSYFVLFYTLFFKNHIPMFGFIQTQCLYDSCITEISYQLTTFVMFHLIGQNLMEYGYPKVKEWFLTINKMAKIIDPKVELADMSSAEKQYRRDNFNSFEEYDEVLVLHGYVVLFSVASPWVALLIVVSIVAEIIVDSKVLVGSSQRTKPVITKTNEPYTTAFEFYGILATFTNVAILIFSSDRYVRWTFTEKLVLFITLEHTIFISRALVKTFLPVVPQTVSMLQLRQQHMVHRCLENIKVEQAQDLSVYRGADADHIEVFESDVCDVTEEDEPQLSLHESFIALKEGIMNIVKTQNAGK